MKIISYEVFNFVIRENKILILAKSAARENYWRINPQQENANEISTQISLQKRDVQK